MRIECATVNDLPAIQALLQVSFPADLQGFMTYMQPGIARYLEAFLIGQSLCPDKHLLVARSTGNEVIGFGEFMNVEPQVGFVNYICVSAAARGQGIACRMIFHYAQMTTGNTSMELDVFQDNLPALRLYEKMGFETIRQSGWWQKPIPAGDNNSTLSITNLPQALLTHQHYGFCQFTARLNERPIQFGRIGLTTLRCADEAMFHDDPTLARIRHALPELTTAFLICPLPACELQAAPFKTSIRMVLAGNRMRT